MKTILQEIFIYTLSLYFVSLFLSGIKVSGGAQAYILGGIVLAIGFTIVRPIIAAISLPLNVVTIGLFSFVISAGILYVTTRIIPQIQVTSFQLPAMSLLGIDLRNVQVSGFLSFVVISATIYGFAKLITWIFD